VDLSALARRVVEAQADGIARSHSEVTLHAPEPVVGAWDPRRIEVVLANLLSNAVKFGDGKPIEISVGSAGGLALLTIRDRGMGISAADQRRIFDRFERAVSEQNFGGFGLGLWVTREVVEAHGGRVSVESARGEGSTFRVELPLDSVVPPRS
jgi:signal transduction histidine kinase